MHVVRVPQRQMYDCAICVAAMVLSYSYERVLDDRLHKYPQLDDKTAWWESYFGDEGRRTAYLPLSELDVVQATGSNVLAVLHLSHPNLQAGHVVVLDERGVADPSDGFPEHLVLVNWVALKVTQGFVLEGDFLAVS